MKFLNKTYGAIALSILLLSGNSHADDFKLESPNLQDGGQLPNKQVANTMGCKGDNLSPALKWNDPPAGTKSLAITIYDPDAPTGSGWWHWLVYNIPASTRTLNEGAGTASGIGLPKDAVQVRNDEGKKEFGGACPPVGDKPHHYIITLYALSVDSLKVPSDASPAMVGFMLNKSVLAKTSITPEYSRNQ